MLDTIEIKPKEGLSKLKFYITMNDVSKHLGEAEEIESIDEGENNKTVIWHYWDKGISLFFDVNHNNIFTCAEVDNEQATLWGNKIFEYNEEQVIQLCKSKGFKEIDMEQDVSGEKRVSFDDALIDFYFENDTLISINYGVLIDDDKAVFLPN